jgi:hypothetical protein
MNSGPITNRFNWLKKALLGDIQTFENTIQSAPWLVQGGGNLSIPIVICTGLELASALYVGGTNYIGKVQKYDATTNVELFINEFFIGHAREIPRLIWDGVRNGIDHLFFPKALRYSEFTIQFTFYRGGESQAIKTNNFIEMRINISELFSIFKQAIERFEDRLRIEDQLQLKFITAWDSFESYIRNIDPSETKKFREAQFLLVELNQTDHVRLF